MSGANPTPLITPGTPSHSEALWWQHHAVGMFSLAGTGKLVRIGGILDGANTGKFLRETCLSPRDLRLGRRFTFLHVNDPKHTAKATLEWFKGKHFNVLEWPSQSSDIQLRICGMT